MPRNPQVNFYLKPKDKDGKCLIFLQFKYNNQRLVYSFGQRILYKNWSSAKQRVKNVNQTTDDGMYNLNQLLDTLRDTCENAYNNYRAKGVIPHAEVLKSSLEAVVNQNYHTSSPGSPTLYNLIERFIEGEIKYKGK